VLRVNGFVGAILDVCCYLKGVLAKELGESRLGNAPSN